jgi:uncharacterized coiled-coil DUF342 family protein
MSGIWRRADERDRHVAERAVLRTMYDEVAAERDALLVDNLRMGVERDEAQKRVDFLNDRLHAVGKARNEIEAERDEAIALLRRVRPMLDDAPFGAGLEDEVYAFLKHHDAGSEGES